MTQLCRACANPLSTLFVDLGLQPISNAFRTAEESTAPETFYPLRAYVCDVCKLVQLQDFTARETHFHGDYIYFSSFATSWLEHARRFVETAIPRFSLDENSQVVEIASNDGYLLQYFVERGIPSFGVDPAANCAAAAKARGVQAVVDFFGCKTAERLRENGQGADLIVANNVLAHVPDLNDFVSGLAILLKPEGTVTAEFPHLLELIANTQFDTIYHEHYSYLSGLALMPLFARHRLKTVDVERLSTHGGSLRLYLQHESAVAAPEAAVGRLIEEECAAGLDRMETYKSFGERTKAAKRALLELLISLKDAGKTIVGYGAPAKGNTLLNYCGIGTDFLDYTVDRNPAKQGRILPGTGIPVLRPEAIYETKPDYVLVLPWNIQDEIMSEWLAIEDWGGRFITLRPELAIVSPRREQSAPGEPSLTEALAPERPGDRRRFQPPLRGSFTPGT